MQEIKGVYKVEMLGQFGWERFSTAFIHDGKYLGASAAHFTTGSYQLDGEKFNMIGNLTQHVGHRSLFGAKDARELQISFNGSIDKNVITGEASAESGQRYVLKFRLIRLSALN